jgi:hypothetical protein
MVVIRLAGGRVFMPYEALCAFSCASLNFTSMTFIFESSTRCVQIYALSSQSFAHSTSNLLMFAIVVVNVVNVLALPSLSSGGVPDVL